ncbi:DUF2127 domain-containing protein [Paracoccus sp. (in: a-proteobacteria)]|uniref:DUF2127 domain-containing protein n=1 Tax=Paracoccus sp. TaxID=267 RepID=UPI0026E09F64|nr:DUF2127 domain-containing protein [Paracoccus sp. (in: a-proteobacteria)]MDO5646522.1 DUF2127 domain-containing protein [Paracoccus sp. (in: a-proteobacteria)]
MHHRRGRYGVLHGLFQASIAMKAAFATLETLSGAALLWASNDALIGLVDWLTHAELIEDPTAPVAGWLVAQAARFDASSQHFYALYLLGHGAIKLVVLALLARRISFAYPLAMVAFAGFVVYQLHRWTLTGSPVMLALSAFDGLVIWLTWREWRSGPARDIPPVAGTATEPK